MNGKDVALAGLGLLTIASLSIGEFNRQQFEGQLTQFEVDLHKSMQIQSESAQIWAESIKNARLFCINEDMQFVKLLNETRGAVGLPIMNYAVAKER